MEDKNNNRITGDGYRTPSSDTALYHPNRPLNLHLSYAFQNHETVKSYHPPYPSNGATTPYSTGLHHHNHAYPGYSPPSKGQPPGGPCGLYVHNHGKVAQIRFKYQIEIIINLFQIHLWRNCPRIQAVCIACKRN